MGASPFLPGAVRQEVRAEGGHAYGVIGADLHVLPGRGPVYLLANYAPESADRAVALDGGGLRVQPSYLLNARLAVVDFTGRRDEVRDLTAWRDSDRPLAVRWLHAPGGQGKTRLARHIADQSMRRGWKVITAEHTAGRVDANNPASQDLRIGDAAGLLLVVDYADRWPLAHLTWLFSNTVLNQDVPVRVLLLARTAHVWPSLCHALIQAGWPSNSCAAHRLGPLPKGQDSRTRMFIAARDGFARCYRLPDPDAIGVPDGLERDEFGLTLAVHMAALVAVDRYARSAAQQSLAEGMTGLTIYLLDREHHHWRSLYETGASHAALDPAGGRVAFSTDPEQMTRAVFTAALTGPLGYRDAKAALDTIGVGTDADRVLDDHTFCYPPADARTVLEPLYPDRLAEDFLALCLPGHDLPGPWAKAWADGAPQLLLTPTADGQALPPYAARAITFLTAATERWPHVLATLETLEPLLPDDPTEVRGEVAVAAAELVDRLTERRLATATAAASRAEIYDKLGRWLDRADRRDKAAEVLAEATRLYRDLAATHPRTFAPRRARAALNLAQVLVSLGMEPEEGDFAQAARAVFIPQRLARPEEALAAFHEAVATFRRLAEENPDEYEEDLATALVVAAFLGPHLGPPEQAAEFAREADELTRRLARIRPEEWGDTVPYTLITRAATLAELEPAQAEEFAREAVEAARQLEHDDAEAAELFSMVLVTQAVVLLRLGKAGQALAVLREAVAEEAVRPRNHAAEYDAWSDILLLTLGETWVHTSAEHVPAVLATVLEMLRLLARDLPDGAGPAVLQAFQGLNAFLVRAGCWEEVLVAQREVIDLLKSMDGISHDNSVLDKSDIVGVLSVTGSMLASLGRWEEALIAVSEAATELEQEGRQLRRHCLAGVVHTITLTLAGVEDDDPTADIYQRLARDETVPVLNHIEATYRQLARENPTEFEPGLVITLEFRSEALWRLQRSWEAWAAGLEAVAVHRRLAQDGTAASQDHLALALRRLAEKSLELGRYEEAEAAADEAAGIRRQLAREDPAEHEPGLAAALHLVAVARRRLRPEAPEDAVAPAQEVAAILTRLASTRAGEDDPDFPEVHDNLAAALDHLAEILRDVGRNDEASTTMIRAIAVYRRLAGHDPATHVPRLARNLWGVAYLRTVVADDLVRAWLAIEEAVGLYMWLAAHDPEAYEDDLHGAATTRDDILRDLASYGPIPVKPVCPMPGTMVRYAAGTDDGSEDDGQRPAWLVLVDPAWWPGGPEDVPPSTAMIGGWQLDENGQPGLFTPNPGYTPVHPAAPTDPTDFVLHQAAAGGDVADRLLPTLRNAVLEIACDEHDRPVLAPAPDGVQCVLVVTAPQHKRRLTPKRWRQVPGSALPDIVPDGVDIFLNPGGSAQFRLVTTALRAPQAHVDELQT